MSIIYPLLRKALFLFNPEFAHDFVKTASSFVPLPVLRSLTNYRHPSLRTRLGKMPIANPIGLAAGFDKNGDMIGFLAALGFGFLELGSITAMPCKGNPKPRIIRLTQQASLINRMGLPNIGADHFTEKFIKNPMPVPCGINIAKTPDFAYEALRMKPLDAVTDFLTTYQKVYRLGAYTVFNLSCPNTGESRTFDDPILFKDLGEAIKSMNTELKDAKPVYIKLSPDLDPAKLKKTVELALKFDFDGFVVGNTTRERPGIKTKIPAVWREQGGLSGAKLTDIANAQLQRVNEIVAGKKTLIAVGGIMHFKDLLEKLSLGADFCQIYTGLIYNGPFFIRDLNKKLAAFCDMHRLKSYREIREINKK